MPLSTLDVTALGAFAGLILAFEIVTSRGPLARRTLSASIERQRRSWMENMIHREQRQLDAILLSSLSQSNAFFASTSVLGIGGLAAVMGAGDAVRPMLERLPIVATSSPALFETKILLLIAILIYAFFKFAWAFRLSHYTGIMFGAMPPISEATAAECARHARQTAGLLDLVGHHANGGLRSFYYAFAALAWLFHPVLLILATLLVVGVLTRREFVSRAARLMKAIDDSPPQ